MSSDLLAALCATGVLTLLLASMAAGLRGAVRDSRAQYFPTDWDWDRPGQDEND